MNEEEQKEQQILDEYQKDFVEKFSRTVSSSNKTLGCIFYLGNNQFKSKVYIYTDFNLFNLLDI